MENKLDAAENKWLRILKISYREHVMNEEFRRNAQHLKIYDIVKKRKMKWAGHVLKMNDSRNSIRIIKCKQSSNKNEKGKEQWEDQQEDV